MVKSWFSFGGCCLFVQIWDQSFLWLWKIGLVNETISNLWKDWFDMTCTWGKPVDDWKNGKMLIWIRVVLSTCCYSMEFWNLVYCFLLFLRMCYDENPSFQCYITTNWLAFHYEITSLGSYQIQHRFFAILEGNFTEADFCCFLKAVPEPFYLVRFTFLFIVLSLWLLILVLFLFYSFDLTRNVMFSWSKMNVRHGSHISNFFF